MIKVFSEFALFQAMSFWILPNPYGKYIKEASRNG